MALDAALPAILRPASLTRGLTARVGLTAVVVASALVRTVAAAGHVVPRCFPDEYLYTSLARSLGSGGPPAVRGVPVNFPAILEPLLAAPFQALFDPVTAYRLTQAENALLMSAAAVPVYLLARHLSLTASWALGAAAFAVCIPDLLYTSFTLADPVAYPLVLASVYVGVRALERPAARWQLAFLAFAGLATLARAQYVVLFGIYVVATLALDRQRGLRRQWPVLGALSIALLAVIAIGPARALGFYAQLKLLHVGSSLARWTASDLFLLSLGAGVAIVPGAIVALARPRGRAEQAFTAIAAGLIACLVLEAALFGSNDLDRFEERYAFALLPLLPVAFGLYVKHGLPRRIPVSLLSAGLLFATMRVPLAGYAGGLGRSDSPFLIAVDELDGIVGAANGSLLVALVASCAAFGAVAASYRRAPAVALGVAIACGLVTSVGATASDLASERSIARGVPSNPSWVDAAALGHVTLVQTAGSPPNRALQALYWNRTVDREALLGQALATDFYAASPQIRVASDGTLLGVGSSVLFQGYGATARFANAVLLGSFRTFRLLHASGAPRLALLEEGRYADGWLARHGELTVWPDATGRTVGTTTFTLTLPRGAHPLAVHVGGRTLQIRPGRATLVRYRVDVPGAWRLRFGAARGTVLPDFRQVSVRSTPPVFRRTAQAAPQPARLA